ncbi:MAG TPA: TIGR03621 family F420-dependent LLM class oxidoreductase [Methylomirabilota bacterium]|jgi:probable F420-dependent oxidoreductase|nr:TIGR03621 family F420-dependent LLM class oxidoreductase [Methylomirabilota bacterium]
MKPFRFGVNLRSAGSREEWAAKARRVEALGYAVLSVPDHLAAMLAPLPALVAAADATRHLRVATAVLNNDFRHPVVLAREAATVDVLTGGRLQLGLGAGHMKAEYDQAGLTFDPGPTRIERLAEAVAIITGLLSGEPLTYTGRHYRVSGHTIHPRPVQIPHPPIFIGGNAPPLLALAARQADIVGLTGIAFRRGGTAPDVSGWRAARVDKQVRLVREAAGERFDALELNALIQRVVVTDDRRRAAQELAQRWTQLSVEDVLTTPFLLIGTVEQMAEDLCARRERWGLSYHLVHEEALEALAPVVARLA